MIRKCYALYNSLNNKSRGRYYGRNPKQAASKCASKIFQRLEYNTKTSNWFTQVNNTTIRFYIRSLSRNSKNNKIYCYQATKIKLNVPLIITIGGGKMVQFHHRIIIKKYLNDAQKFLRIATTQLELPNCNTESMHLSSNLVIEI